MIEKNSSLTRLYRGARIAAAAYLSLMTCPRVDEATIGALAAFRDRHRELAAGF